MCQVNAKASANWKIGIFSILGMYCSSRSELWKKIVFKQQQQNSKASLSKVITKWEECSLKELHTDLLTYNQPAQQQA